MSSLNAPSLFLIAKDLTRIQVWVSVNEADIGSVHPGMPATFTVDAFPNQVFRGQVGKVRLNATMTQNVVTYTVEVTTDNSDGRLLPYLTANVQFITGRREGVLVVPNAALRWQPQPNQIAAEFRPTAEARGQKAEARGSKPQPELAAPRPGTGTQHQGTLWVEQGEFVRPIKVSVGLTDGTQTEVESSDLAEGMQVVVSDQMPQSLAGSAPGASPFTPQLGRARGNAAQGAPGGGGQRESQR